MRPETSKSTAFVSGPGWLVYTLGTVAWTVVSLPATVACFAVPALRPHPRWSFQTSFFNHLTRIATRWAGVTEFPTPQIDSVKPGLGTFVWLEPGGADMYGAELLVDTDISPRRVGAVWVPAPPAADKSKDKRIVLHFHGGAYVALSPGLANVQSGPRLLAAALDTSALLVDYRLACNPGGRHPAALQDALTAYNAVLATGVRPQQIIITGDSAGSHLVLMLLRHIEEQGRLLHPASAGLFSPWADMTPVLDDIFAGPNAKTDYLTKDLVVWAYREFVPPGISVDTPYLSPTRYPFRTQTRLFLASSSAEVMLKQHVAAKDAFKSIAGNVVEYYEATDAPHDLFAAGDDLGLGQEQQKVIRAAADFFSK